MFQVRQHGAYLVWLPKSSKEERRRRRGATLRYVLHL